MRVAIPSTGDDLSAAVDPRFGRCNRFLIIDTESMAFQVLDNTAAASAGGAGIAAAQLVVDAGAEAVAAGEVGPNAMRVLEAAGVRVLTGVRGTVAEAARAAAAAPGAVVAREGNGA